MSARAPTSRQNLVASWVAQMIGTLALCAVATVFIKSMGKPLLDGDNDWKRYAAIGILVGAAPAMLYLRWYKVILDQDVRLERERGGNPDPGARHMLQKALMLGGALCEIPMAMGVLQLLLGGEMRWFLGATLLTIALRLSYRPFVRKR
jgi:hypothetical protein